ncbi:MAG: hypothetical protein MZU97_03770 [Bacillus subtilis]|nr:hypothetical protein [Bacillus subtilis]
MQHSDPPRPADRPQPAVDRLRQEALPSARLRRQGGNAQLSQGSRQHLRMRRLSELHVRLHGPFDAAI